MVSTKTNINLENRYDRVIILIDMDCFYCQVEEKLNPDLKGKPIAVVQYNAWRGGGIIAVNYPARENGVTRHMRGDEAQEHCPEIILVRVPNVREKADLTKYREAGKKVAEVLQTFTPLLERASVDEAYLDITEQVKIRLKEMNEGTYKILPHSLGNTFAVGYESIGLYIHEISANQSDLENELPEFNEEENNFDPSLCQKYNLNLLIGATIASEIRAKVKEKTGYECSAGIAHNKILSKLACGINKPNKQTILSVNETSKLLKSLPIPKIKGLGGKFGEEIISDLQIKTIGDLLQFSKMELQRRYDEKNGHWLFLIARGVDLETVTPRFYSKSIGCCKKFPGKNAITGLNTLTHWLGELANEIADRLDKDIVENNRKAKQMVVSFVQEINSNDISSSRSGTLSSYDPGFIAKTALEILQKNTNQFLKQENSKSLNNPIKFLGISVGKFENLISNQTTLQEMFSKQKPKVLTTQLQEISVDVESVNTLKINSVESNDDTTSNTASDDTIKNFDVNKNFHINGVKMVKGTHPENEVNFNNQEAQITLQTNFGIATLVSLENKQALEHINFVPYVESPVTIHETRNLDEAKSKSSSFKETANLSESSQKSESPNSIHLTEPKDLDYTKTYAEYMCPLQTEADYVKCSECGLKVLSLSLQTHLDGHLAFKLSQQLREEYRNELKSQLPNDASSKNKKHQLNNSSTKKNSIKKKKLETPSTSDITKYLKPYEKPVTNEENYVKCSECSFFVDETKIFEHQDLHLAQKINREWNFS